MIIRETKSGKRIVIVEEFGGFRIRVQEHKSICGQYISDADNGGWRNCTVEFRDTLEEAKSRMEHLAKYC